MQKLNKVASGMILSGFLAAAPLPLKNPSDLMRMGQLLKQLGVSQGQLFVSTSSNVTSGPSSMAPSSQNLIIQNTNDLKSMADALESARLYLENLLNTLH